MKKINLKCEGVELWGDSQTKRRYEQTLRRVRRFYSGGTVLDAGGYSEFGNKLADELLLGYDYTLGDLNFPHVYPPAFDYIFCFEVIEHLLNPLTFFKYINFDEYIFLTYPYSPIFQGKRHFHEMTDDQFYTLIDEAGLKIVHHDKFRNFNTLKIIFSGFRPLIKFFMQLIGLSYINFYVLEKK